MKVKTIIFVILAMVLGMASTTVYAQPPLPHAFYGTVEINDSPAPVGTEVEVRGEGVLTGIEGNPIITTELGKYGGPGGLDPKLVVQGEIEDGAILTFYVNSVEAETEPAPVEWHSGEITEVNLSATITAPGGGGGGGGDTTAPRISNVLLCPEGVTETTADICWTTDEQSTSQVEYWASPSMLSPLDETYVIEHHVHLSGLTPGTTYHYKTMSRDRAGNLVVSDEYTFTTLGEAPEEVPPPEEAPPEEAPPKEAPPEEAPPPTAPPEVKPPINWALLGGIIAGVVIVGLLIFFLVRRRTA